jgi:hypothetical protein
MRGVLLTRMVVRADCYENGTPAWAGGETPRKIARGGNPVTCDFADSVDWLRPKGLARAVRSGAAASQEERSSAEQRASEGKWCPFTGGRGSAGVAVSSSR